MTVSTNSTNLQQLQITRSKIYAALISLGTPLLIFAAFGLLRASVFTQQPDASESPKLPPGLYQRSQTEDAWTPPTPQPAITVEPGYSEYPVPTATGETGDTQSEMLRLWEQRGNGRFPADTTIPGCTAELNEDGSINSDTVQCWGGYQFQLDTYSNNSRLPQQSGFSAGSGDEANTNISHHNGQWAVDGYATSSGMRSGK